MEFAKHEKTLFEIGYRVAKDGTVINPKGKIVSGSTGNIGYYKIVIRRKYKKIGAVVHRMVAYQKYGEEIYKNGIVVRHKNGNPLDNSFDNILIGTYSDNMMDQPKDQRVKKAVHAASHLIKYDRDAVIEYYNDCKSYKKTMEEFNISSKGTLNAILKSKQNYHLP